MMKNLRWNCYRIYVDPTRKLLPDTAAARCSRWQLSPLLPERTFSGSHIQKARDLHTCHTSEDALQNHTIATCLYVCDMTFWKVSTVSSSVPWFSLIFSRKSMSSHFENPHGPRYTTSFLRFAAGVFVHQGFGDLLLPIEGSQFGF